MFVSTPSLTRRHSATRPAAAFVVVATLAFGCALVVGCSSAPTLPTSQPAERELAVRQHIDVLGARVQ